MLRLPICLTGTLMQLAKPDPMPHEVLHRADVNAGFDEKQRLGLDQ